MERHDDDDGRLTEERILLFCLCLLLFLFLFFFFFLLSVYIYTCNSSCVQCTSVCLSFDFHRFRQFLFLLSPGFGVMLRTALSAGSIRWTAWFLSPPPPSRSFGFLFVFGSRWRKNWMRANSSCLSTLVVDVFWVGLGFGVFCCAWQWHARPDFFCFQLSNWIMASSNRAHLSLSPLLIVLFVNVSSFGTIRRSYPLADQQRHYIQSRRM